MCMCAAPRSIESRVASFDSAFGDVGQQETPEAGAGVRSRPRTDRRMTDELPGRRL
jgi:hypothetical protein